MKLPSVFRSRCRFGLATGDMTPPIGIYHRMWGAAKHDRATGIHQPLRASVIVFAPSEDSTPLNDCRVMVALDHCILGTRELAIITDAVVSNTQLTSEQIVVVCSHTHAAGLLSLDRIPLPGGELIFDYLQSVAITVAQLTQEALERMTPANLVTGMARCSLATNRDYWDHVTQQYVCGFNPNEAADDTVLVTRVNADDGNLLATIVNYACHPTTLAWDNTLISPDYPGSMRDLIEQTTSAPCVFLQGASGELGPREGFVGDVSIAERNGKQLGYAALASLQDLPLSDSCFQYTGPVVSGATIGTWAYRSLTVQERARNSVWSAWQGTIEIPYRSDLPSIDYIQSELARFEQEEIQLMQEGNTAAALHSRAMGERSRRELARRRALPVGEMLPYQVALWRIGETVWLAVQGEPYSLLQTELRKRFPETTIIVCSLGFSWGVAYLPPAEKYGLGLYQEKIAVVAPGALERVVEVLEQKIRQLLN